MHKPARTAQHGLCRLKYDEALFVQPLSDSLCESSYFQKAAVPNAGGRSRKSVADDIHLLGTRLQFHLPRLIRWKQFSDRAYLPSVLYPDAESVPAECLDPFDSFFQIGLCSHQKKIVNIPHQMLYPPNSLSATLLE